MTILECLNKNLNYVEYRRLADARQDVPFSYGAYETMKEAFTFNQDK